MTTPFGTDIEVIGGAEGGLAPRIRDAVVDGTLPFAVGSALAAAFGPAAIQSIIDSDTRGAWWHLLLTVAGFLVIGGGFLLRRRKKRTTRVAIIAVAQVAHWSRERLQSQIDDGMRHLSGADIIVKVSCVLPDDPDAAGVAVDQMVESVRFAMSVGTRIHRDTSEINIVPIMPLHAAFRFGAGLGYTHSIPVVIQAPMQRRNGAPAYVPIPLRDTEMPAIVRQAGESRAGGTGSGRVAFAINLQNFTEEKFLDRVREQCGTDGYPRIVPYDANGTHIEATPAAVAAEIENIVRLRDCCVTE